MRRLVPVISLLLLTACHKDIPVPKGGPVLEAPGNVPVISWERAKEYERKGPTIVEGTVVTVEDAGTVYITFHTDAHHTFVVTIPETKKDAIETAIPTLGDLQGTRIRVKGTITHNNDDAETDRPEMSVTDASQITIEEAAAAPAVG